MDLVKRLHADSLLLKFVREKVHAWVITENNMHWSMKQGQAFTSSYLWTGQLDTEMCALGWEILGMNVLGLLSGYVGTMP